MAPLHSVTCNSNRGASPTWGRPVARSLCLNLLPCCRPDHAQLRPQRWQFSFSCDGHRHIGAIAKEQSCGITDESLATYLDSVDPRGVAASIISSRLAMAKFRGEFHIPPKNAVRGENPAPPALEGDSIYLCGNSLGLQPKRLGSYVQEELDKWANVGVQGHFSGKRPWLTIDDPVVPHFIPLLGAKKDEIAVMETLTANIHTMLIPFYRPTEKRYKLIIEKGAFPSDRYIASSQTRHHELPDDAVVEVAPRENESVLRTEDIIATIKEHGDSVALVMFPGLQYQTGQVFDIKAITEAGHSVGAYVGFDLAHAVGNVRLNLHDDGPDFACWCTYKYLNSGPGNIGGLFVHERHHNSNLPRSGGWWGHELSTRFKMTDPFNPIAGAFGFRHSNPSVLSCVSLLASLDIFSEATFEACLKKQRTLTGYLEVLIDTLLKDKVNIITPRTLPDRGSQLSIEFLTDLQTDVAQMEHTLANLGAVVDVRGKIIRVAPTPLYNTYSDVWNFVKILEEVTKDW